MVGRWRLRGPLKMMETVETDYIVPAVLKNGEKKWRTIIQRGGGGEEQTPLPPLFPDPLLLPPRKISLRSLPHRIPTTKKPPPSSSMTPLAATLDLPPINNPEAEEEVEEEEPSSAAKPPTRTSGGLNHPPSFHPPHSSNHPPPSSPHHPRPSPQHLPPNEDNRLNP